jgi:uncharacterized membrane protein YhiD involved in acid resistance
MLELFPDQPVYEYPQLINSLYSFLWAFVLSSLIAITHKLTFNGVQYPKNFFQSLILGSIVTAMVMMAIGDSLARGLGVFGAMAIIRFRTRIDDPRDVLFLFAALSTGLAVGVFGFTVSFAGTLLFCAVAFILHASPFKINETAYLISFNASTDLINESAKEVIMKFTTSLQLQSAATTKENVLRYQYKIQLTKQVNPTAIIHAVESIEGISQAKIILQEINNV